jgi:hypothetical protein
MLLMALNLSQRCQIMLINTLGVSWDSLIEVLKHVDSAHSETHREFNRRAIILTFTIKHDQTEKMRVAKKSADTRISKSSLEARSAV